MKRKSNDNTVSEVIELMMHQYGLSGRYREFRLLQSWSQIMGPMVANRTDDLYIRNRTLYIKLKSAALRSELSYGRSRIIELLNEAAGGDVISEIVFI